MHRRPATLIHGCHTLAQLMADDQKRALHEISTCCPQQCAYRRLTPASTKATLAVQQPSVMTLPSPQPTQRLSSMSLTRVDSRRDDDHRGRRAAVQVIRWKLVQRTHTRVELAVSACTGCVVNPQAATACWRVSCGYAMVVKIFRR